MQRKVSDFSKLPIILESICSELEDLKREHAEWCSVLKTTITKLHTDYSIELIQAPTRRAQAFTTLNEYRNFVAIPYIDSLLLNIKNRFSDKVVQLLVSAAVFNPASFPSQEDDLLKYGNCEVQCLIDFYGKEAQIELQGKTYCSPAIVYGEEVLAEWRIFKRLRRKGF